MKSEAIYSHFKLLKQQRKDFYSHSYESVEDPWKSLAPGKWSMGQTLYHLVLMVQVFRIFSKIYIPVMRPFACLFRNKAYKKTIRDIYGDYQQDNQKVMSAPFLIVPPNNLEEKYSIREIRKLLESETEQLMQELNEVEQSLAGHIRYPDPVADYPNLIQCIHLLAIHEQHHFELAKKYLNFCYR